MTRKLLFVAALLAVLLFCLSASADSRTRLRLGGISIGAGYSHYSGSYWPYYYRHYPYAFWYSPAYLDPYWAWVWAPYYHPAYFAGFARGDDKGEVKLAGAPREAEVFLNGAYAGTAGDLRSMWLDPGAYNLVVKPQNAPAFERRIYVLTGKTLKIAAEVKP